LQDVEKSLNFLRFFQKDPLRDNFQNSVPKGFIVSPTDVLCSNFVKFGRRKIGEIVRCLTDNKKNKISPRSPDLATAQIETQNVPGPPQECTQSASDFIQTGSLSAELHPNA